MLFERSEFTDDSVVFHQSSEAGAALIFSLLRFFLDQAKRNEGPSGGKPATTNKKES
ncbi:MAG: hypothetical protein ACLVEJ_08350 [Parabacteroides sp.]